MHPGEQPEAPPQVRMRQQVPPEEVLHRAVAEINLGESDDGTSRSITFVIPAPNKQYTFLIPAEIFEQVAKKMLAPRVERPPGLLVPEGAR